MDPRLSALPHATQAAVRDAAKVLAKAQRVYAEKQRVTDLATRHGQAAALRSRRFQEAMEQWTIGRPTP